MINNNPTNDSPIDDNIDENLDENPTKVSFWSNFTKIMKKSIKVLLKGNRSTRHIIDCFQLSFIYFFAFVVLSYSIQGYLGGFPELVFYFLPHLQEILNVQGLKILATPEKTFVVYLIVIELLMSRSRFNFSLLVKFNILLIFVLEMMQNLAISYWDLIFNREIEYSYVGEVAVIAHDVAQFFFLTLYAVCVLTYGYCFLRSCLGRFPVFAGPASFVTDSVAFWLRIKIPRKGKKNKKK